MGANQMDYIHIIANASLMVKFVLMLLLFFSVTSWSIIIIKARYIRKAFRQSDIFIDYFWKSRDLASAFTKAKQLDGSPVARIFRTAYSELRKLNTSGKAVEENSGPEKPTLRHEFSSSGNVKRALRRAINTEMTRLGQMVPFLATTGNTTPFIGLFGTVWGIMNSFHGIGQRGSASLAVVAPGISEALVATAAGLAVAIPAVIAFNHFMQKIRIIETELNSFSADFLNILERDILR
ncbi:Protein TolQ [Desulfosarcina cetonica]|uniref:protein TolQ n=1 Tax=Desulfosarcina cetonica TaxID=90730 RepID=UPI0006D222E0|nr:protein TolQ [Desulfosarcina cetonica]VTR66156.1 Protein TolQ [Desulfosarcina cetonica]